MAEQLKNSINSEMKTGDLTGGLGDDLGSIISSSLEGQSQAGDFGKYLSMGLAGAWLGGSLLLLANTFFGGSREDSKPDSNDETHIATSDSEPDLNDETHRATSGTPCVQKQGLNLKDPPAIEPAPKKRRTSYSGVTASDVVKRITKEELIKKFRKMLTDHRTVLLEARDLIDSDCRDIIQAKLRSGERAGAATELVEYFEANHDGDKMMDFCTFLEDQAGESAPLLKKLALKIREIVETLSDTS